MIMLLVFVLCDVRECMIWFGGLATTTPRSPCSCFVVVVVVVIVCAWSHVSYCYYMFWMFDKMCACSSVARYLMEVCGDNAE